MTSTGKKPLPCLGTKTISLRNGEDEKEGLLTVFHIQAAGEEGLRIYITDGNAVYHGTIDMEMVSMPSIESLDASRKAVELADFLLGKSNPKASDKEKISSSYALQQDKGILKVAIKFLTKKKKEGIEKTKRAWGGELKRSTDLFSLYKVLGESINEGKQNLETTKQQMQVVQDERDSWKSTAHKLEGAWQKEKDTVFQNFVKLYNATCEELVTARSELEKAQLAARSEQDDGQKPRRGKKRPKEEVAVTDQPDDQDLNVFDENMVNALSAGKKVALSATTAGRKRGKAKVKIEPDSEEEDISGTTKKKRTTKAKAKVKRELDSDEDIVPKKKSKTTVKQQLNYDSDDSTAKRVRRMLKGGDEKKSRLDSDAPKKKPKTTSSVPVDSDEDLAPQKKSKTTSSVPAKQQPNYDSDSDSGVSTAKRVRKMLKNGDEKESKFDYDSDEDSTAGMVRRMLQGGGKKKSKVDSDSEEEGRGMI